MTSACNKNPKPIAVHFFKNIFRTSLAHGLLKLPTIFTKKYGDGMSNPVSLKSPDSTRWKIYWTNHDGEIWFQKGWKEFATYYGLDHGHLLFFEYEGTSHFDVHIFDASAVEIDYPSNGTHHVKDSSHVEISDDPVEILDEKFSCQKTREKSTVSSPQPTKKMKAGLTTNVEKSTNVVNLHQHVQMRSTRSQKAKFVKHELDEDEGRDIFNTEWPKVGQLTSTALNRATAFRSENPTFRLVMNPSFINGDCLEIPPEFAEIYLKTHAVVILEVLEGRTWPVICSAPRITGGWHKFASENHLNVGDICVFELIQEIQGLAFKVSIFRGAEEPSCPISQGGSSSKKSSWLESSHFKPKILTTREEASKFTSENPFFMVTLTPNYLKAMTKCPQVPMDFVRKYFVQMNRNVVMLQFRKKLWPVKFVFFEYNSQGTLSAGWPLFARENKLEPGDVCIFELVNREDATLDVHVFRGEGNTMH